MESHKGSLWSLAVHNEMHLFFFLFGQRLVNCHHFLEGYLDQTISKPINNENFKTELIKQGMCPSSRKKKYSVSGSIALVIQIKEHLFCLLEQIEWN